LPDEVVADRNALGRVVTAKASLISGFERSGFFYAPGGRGPGLRRVEYRLTSA
jgi:hypothetical protein